MASIQALIGYAKGIHRVILCYASHMSMASMKHPGLSLSCSAHSRQRALNSITNVTMPKLRTYCEGSSSGSSHACISYTHSEAYIIDLPVHPRISFLLIRTTTKTKTTINNFLYSNFLISLLPYFLHFDFNKATIFPKSSQTFNK
jgi:hypothetical protein